MEIFKINSIETDGKQATLKESVGKRILFVLDYVNNAAYREDVSHVSDDGIEDYVEEKYG